MDIPTHHLIYGVCTDLLTGETIVDTDDERIRQEIIRLMLEEKGYEKGEIVPRRAINTLFGGRFVTSIVDLSFFLQGKCFMALRYGPGSLVTRERAAVAAARVIEPDYVVPFAAVTNGRDAELIDSVAAKAVATGMDSLPSRNKAMAMLAQLDFSAGLTPGKREKELRILNAYDFEQCCAGCPCPLPGAREG